MKDAFGGIINMLFIALFLLIMIGILGLVVSYTKAFKMKNIIISYIEQYEASGCFIDDTACMKKIKASAEGIGYGSRIRCPEGYGKIDGLFCYKEIISTSKYKCKSSVKSYLWYNRVSILDNYRYSLGGKNGYTPDAGKTLISYARKDDVTLGIVTLNDGDIYNNQIKLFNEYFDEYSKYKIIDKDKFYIDKNLFKDDVYIKEDFYYLLSRDELDKITTLISIYNDESLEVVGNISIKLNNIEIGNLDIYRNKKKKQLSFFQRIKNYLLDIL